MTVCRLRSGFARTRLFQKGPQAQWHMEVVLTYLKPDFVSSAIQFFPDIGVCQQTISEFPLTNMLMSSYGNDGDDRSQAIATLLERNPHLELFQKMGQILPRDPVGVVARVTDWLRNAGSSLWAPFALSLRGFAYEVMEELDLARRDYARGLNLYGLLLKELGPDAVKRMESNCNFMRIRLRTLPPPKPESSIDYVIIEEDDPGSIW